MARGVGGALGAGAGNDFGDGAGGEAGGALLGQAWVALRVLVLQALLISAITCLVGLADNVRCMLALLAGRLPASVPGAPLRGGCLAVRRIPAAEAPAQPDECPICLGSCEEDDDGSAVGGRRPHWCQLHCGHRFHEQCIYAWLWRTQRCPVCRAHLFDNTLKLKQPVA
uniref:RING-type domain-containing protein n=1 Tax=Zooxanthella nutricula TaxID=1333877 RepID=A0A7S2JW75_9DINO|mmetsp:Transcript_37333/g.112881  ORF Transcript_37333/g.112881 Transcript_37333/m.112881 type:complete len:169 (+) Transcript_37333:3-509(+)